MALAATRNVIIAGAGIGGLTAALTLSRAGLRATVLEQAAELEEAGAGIQLSPNATRILIELGLGEELRRTAVEPQAIRVMSGPSAREIVRIPLGRYVENRYGAPYWVIHRGDLQMALANAARTNQDISLKLGCRVEDYASHRNGVSVLARSAGQIMQEQGIALIGADGIWSAVRERVRRQRPPKFRHRTAWRAFVPADAVAPAWREPMVHLWMGMDSHLVHYPIKGGALINIAAIVDDEWHEPGWSATGDPAEVLRRFARWSWADAARDIVAAPQRWQKWALFERGKPMGGSGPVTLLGDAAHPMLPFLAQGGAMAIEDAAVLAGALADAANPAKALRAYEKARRGRTAKVQKLARRQGRIYGMTGPEAVIRNMVMRAMGGQKIVIRQDWLFGFSAPVLDFRDRHVTQMGGDEAEGE
jgi:salicylate hydroxylase